MPKYNVEVDIIWGKTRKDISVYARSEEEAEEKACDIVLMWKNVDDVEVIEVSED